MLLMLYSLLPEVSLLAMSIFILPFSTWGDFRNYFIEDQLFFLQLHEGEDKPPFFQIDISVMNYVIIYVAPVYLIGNHRVKLNVPYELSRSEFQANLFFVQLNEQDRVMWA